MKLRERSYDNALPLHLSAKKRYIRESDKHADKPESRYPVNYLL